MSVSSGGSIVIIWTFELGSLLQMIDKGQLEPAPSCPLLLCDMLPTGLYSMVDIQPTFKVKVTQFVTLSCTYGCTVCRSKKSIRKYRFLFSNRCMYKYIQ